MHTHTHTHTHNETTQRADLPPEALLAPAGELEELVDCLGAEKGCAGNVSNPGGLKGVSPREGFL